MNKTKQALKQISLMNKYKTGDNCEQNLILQEPLLNFNDFSEEEKEYCCKLPLDVLEIRTLFCMFHEKAGTSNLQAYSTNDNRIFYKENFYIYEDALSCEFNFPESRHNTLNKKVLYLKICSTNNDIFGKYNSIYFNTVEIINDKAIFELQTTKVKQTQLSKFIKDILSSYFILLELYN